ncbi:MAG TPA: DUF2586 family protein [Pedobacter sp.]|uniref:DUF2586 family protein n=1 Tax=Pedobacter sp. TaxID=1411316 RepID=UPI002BCAEF0B|nr:DUF2586 family protein [Pedobacter sp.]HMI04280.1 DUF2586 family protein [Pedobacter sp.]
MNNAVEFDKAKPSDSLNSEETSISAIIANGVAVVDKLVLGQPYAIYSPDDARELGIDAAYDAANSVVLSHQIDEFYRGCSIGTKLYLMVVAKAITPTQIFTDGGLLYARKLVAFAQGEITQLAIAYTGDWTEQAPETTTDGLSSEIRACFASAQEFALWAFETERPLHILLEGRNYGGNAGAAVDLKDLVTGADIPLEADKLSVIIAQDYDYAEGLAFASGKKYASVGLALGILAGINVNQNIGEVATLNLTNATKGKFVTGGLSSHVTVEAAEASLVTLDEKGYIFPRKYTGISGYRFNNDHVCAPQIVDSEGVMNESSIAYSRTMDHAVRKLRGAFTPSINSVQPVNEVGKLPVGVVKSFNQKGDDVFDNLAAKGFISAGKTFTDPNSDLLTGEKALLVDFTLQPTGTINKIKGTISLKTSL